MSSHAARRCASVVFVLVVLLALAPARASDFPDAAINPVDGAIELTDAVVDGQEKQIRHVIEPLAAEPPEVAILTESASDNLDPRIEIETTGNTWIVWWRDDATAQVLYRVRDYATGAWSAESRVSEVGVGSRNPQIAHDGATTWVAYEAAGSSGISVVLAGTTDSAEPFPTGTTIATTTFTGSLGLTLQSESGHTWVTWVDSSTEVGWSEYNAPSETWGAAQFQGYSGSNVAAARAAIRSAILEP